MDMVNQNISKQYENYNIQQQILSKNALILKKFASAKSQMAIRAYGGQFIDINQPTEDLEKEGTMDNEVTVETHVTHTSDRNENLRNPGYYQLQYKNLDGENKKVQIDKSFLNFSQENVQSV